MKKSELYLLFFTIFIGVVLLLVTLFKYVSPSKVHIIDDYSVVEEQTNIDSYDDSWINKISNKNQDFIYPTVIFKTKL